MLRGFHWHGLDTAGAIDSYTWFISSLRPSFVADHKIDPDILIERAERDFAVTVKGRKGIDCVDRKAWLMRRIKTRFKNTIKTPVFCGRPTTITG